MPKEFAFEQLEKIVLEAQHALAYFRGAKELLKPGRQWETGIGESEILNLQNLKERVRSYTLEHGHKCLGPWNNPYNQLQVGAYTFQASTIKDNLIIDYSTSPYREELEGYFKNLREQIEGGFDDERVRWRIKQALLDTASRLVRINHYDDYSDFAPAIVQLTTGQVIFCVGEAPVEIVSFQKQFGQIERSEYRSLLGFLQRAAENLGLESHDTFF